MRRFWLAFAAAGGFAAAAYAIAPRAIEAAIYLSVQDDPIALADRALDRGLTAARVTAEIDAALAGQDVELAQSFLELAAERGIAISPELRSKVEAAGAPSARAVSAAENFVRGLVFGEPDDFAGFAGAAAGDLIVFGDLRDAVREGGRLVSGEPADQLILGLSCVGLAVTAGTYALAGTAAPARIGLSLAKIARKTGRVSGQMNDWLGRSLREVVDGQALRRSFMQASLTEPAAAMRGVRQAVKLDKAGGLMRLAADVGQVQSKAGTRAALDGLKLADHPRDVARIAALAGAKGGKTRAILKTLGRGAFTLTLATFDLATWLFSALLTLFGFVASMKGAVERATLHFLRRRKARRARALAMTPVRV
jgi:hypothetical protein